MRVRPTARKWVEAISVVVLAVLVPLPARGGQQSPALVVTGASYFEVDDRSGLWELRGNPVIVTRGNRVVRAAAMTYDSRRSMLTARGAVSVEDEGARLSAASVIAFLQEDRLLAEGEVVVVVQDPPPVTDLRADRLELWAAQQQALATGAVTMKRGEVTVAGDQLTYDLRARHAVATGHPTMVVPQAIISADRIEAQVDREELTADGAVRLVADDLQGSAPRMVLQSAQHLATLSGGAIIRQRRNELRAEVVTIDLQRKQIVATGGAHLVVFPNR